MNEKKKGLIVVIALAVLILFVVVVGIINDQNSKKIYEQFKETLDKKEKSLIVVGRPTCSYCQLLTPSIDEMKERYSFDYFYINTDKLTKKYMNMVMADLELTSISTPYLAVVNDGKTVDKNNGYLDYDKLFEFLQKNEIISKDAKLMLNYIGLEDYQTLLNADTPSIIVVGQSTCHYCIDVKLVLNEIADEYGTKINYLNVTYLDEKEATTFQNSLEFFKSGDWGTPITFVVQNGKMIEVTVEGTKQSVINGLTTKAKYVEFFKAQGVL